MAGEEAKTQTQKLKELVEKPWVLVVLVLHVGVLGIPIYWKLNYSLRGRLTVILASLAYTVFAVFAIVWMLRWIGGKLAY